MLNGDDKVELALLLDELLAGMSVIGFTALNYRLQKQ